tara:strand:+ start:214 stop:546 length:333 start_codon:yes stop_codon:yes gene_type:complete
MSKQYEISSQLDAKLIEKYANELESCTYSTDTPLFYEGNVPVVAYIILSGEVLLSRRKKIIQTLSAGSLIGIKLLHGHTPSLYTAVVKGGSKILFLDRSTLLELSDHQLV